MRADYPYRWTGSAANGTGILPNSCSHIFHLLIHLFGPVEEVIGATRISNKLWMFEDGTSQVPEVADTAVLLARLAGGALVNIHAGRAVPSATGFCVSAYGSKGRLLAASPAYPLDRTVTITAAKAVGLFQRSDENLEIPSRYFEVFGGRVSRESDAAVSISLGRLLSAMLDAIDGGGEAIPSFRRAAHVQHIIAALRRSELSKCWQKVETEMTYPYVANRC
jgi:predicted dehydrogenase